MSKILITPFNIEPEVSYNLGKEISTKEYKQGFTTTKQDTSQQKMMMSDCITSPSFSDKAPLLFLFR